MSPLKNQDRFEQKLKEQFDNFEAKPTDALWENIAQNIPSDDFEKKIAVKLNALQFEPSSNVWSIIEKRLPLIVKFNKKLIYLWTIVTLSIGLFAGYFLTILSNNHTSSKQLTHPKAFVWLNNSIDKELLVFKGESKGQTKILTIIVDKETNEESFTKIITENNKKEKPKLFLNKEQKAVDPISQKLIIDKESIPATTTEITNEQNELQVISKSLDKSNSNIIIENAIINNEPLVTNNQPASVKMEPEKLNLIDSIIEIKSIPSDEKLTNNLAIESNYKGPSLKKEKFTILAYAGLGNSYMRYQAGTNTKNSESNIALREKTEQSISEITGGFLFGYDLTKRITLSSGFVLANFKQTLNFNTDTAEQPINYEENLIYNKDTILIGNTNSKTLNYSYTEIPLFITYKILETQKFEMALQSGLGIGFITGINTYIINENNVGIYEITNKDNYPAFKNTLFFSLQPQFTYNTNSPGVSIGLMPIIKASITNIVADEKWIKQYPYNMSLNVFLRKRF